MKELIRGRARAARLIAIALTVAAVSLPPVDPQARGRKRSPPIATWTRSNRRWAGVSSSSAVLMVRWRTSAPPAVHCATA